MCGVGDHDGRPGMIEATAPDSTSPTRWVAEVEGGVVQRRDSLDQCRAFAQSQGEIISKRRQDAHADVAVRARDERVFAGPLGRRGRFTQLWAEAQTEAAGVAKRRSCVAG